MTSKPGSAHNTRSIQKEEITEEIYISVNLQSYRDRSILRMLLNHKIFMCKINLNIVQGDDTSVFEDSVAHQLSRILHSSSQNVVLSSAKLVINCQYFYYK